MAEKELSILVRAKGAIEAARNIGKVDSAVGKLGRTAAAGARNAAVNVAKIGVVAGAGVALAVRGGLESLAELESATSAVDGAIKQMGLSGQVTSGQIAGWANDIERDVGAAFDDKAIVSATATLLRFGKVTPTNIRPAMQVITDLATKTGDVDSAAALLAKALADPTKAAGKLARSGVILTKAQQDQIKAMVKVNDIAGAQAVVIGAVADVTKGAAAASQGPYARSLSVLKDVTEDAQRALATGFLPVIEKVADLLSDELAKPGTLDNIRKFGQGLAGGLDKLIDVARGLPWGTIGDSLRMAGTGAKAVLDVFTAMPPWVQSAVLTGWGLNKLSGGALGGIVGELGKGLIKGVLGMNAGVVNINAGVVNGGGGLPGIPTAAAGAAAGAGISGGAAAALLLAGPAIGAGLGELSRREFEQMPSHQAQMALRGGRSRQDIILGRSVASAGFGGRSMQEGMRFGAPSKEQTAAALANVRASERTERALSGPVVRELQAVSRITASGNPSQKSAEAHLAELKSLQASTPSRDAANTSAIVTAINELKAVIGRPPTINVYGATAADNSRANVNRKRVVKPAGSRGSFAAEFG